MKTIFIFLLIHLNLIDSKHPRGKRMYHQPTNVVYYVHSGSFARYIEKTEIWLKLA